VTDGLANTYLLGEKYLWSDHYTDGYDGGDDEWALQGYDTDNYRYACDYTTCYDPKTGQQCTWYTANGQIIEGLYEDTPGWPAGLSFGSAHSSGCNMAMCDGSVRIISYGIAPAIHSRLSNRKDGQTVDGKIF
jgi:prepilin-type processing-associated H-X9-DG protein